MSNMSYCRFENTTSDFKECVESIREVAEEGKELSPSEERYSEKLYDLAKEYVELYEYVHNISE